MERKAKDCCNCIHDPILCVGEGLEIRLDERQLRKLIRESDEYGNWYRFYCKKT